MPDIRSCEACDNKPCAIWEWCSNNNYKNYHHAATSRTYEELTERELELYKAKNKDYTRGGDRFGNFNRVSTILSLYPKLSLAKPRVIALVYMLKQLDAALWMLSEGYEGAVENIDTRLTDVHVYAKIARLLGGE